jgi:hypothetical protein
MTPEGGEQGQPDDDNSLQQLHQLVPAAEDIDMLEQYRQTQLDEEQERYVLQQLQLSGFGETPEDLQKVEGVEGPGEAESACGEPLTDRKVLTMLNEVLGAEAFEDDE